MRTTSVLSAAGVSLNENKLSAAKPKKWILYFPELTKLVPVVRQSNKRFGKYQSRVPEGTG